MDHSELESKCKHTIEYLHVELSRMRTGRANTSLLESLMVDYYGSKVPLQQLGLISAPEPRMLTVQIYDGSAIDSVEKSIQQSELQLNPSRDGNLLRIPIPALTEERRKELVKTLHKSAEEGRIAIRNHRREAIDGLKKAEKDKEISEDVLSRGKDEIQKVTDTYIAQVDKLLAEKEKEMMEV
ncbi:MAG: ribosome recycling factor [Bdellovibrionales bacterium]|nr:ribosome recycling factor [Bdellovibrionales bacterium]